MKKNFEVKKVCWVFDKNQDIGTFLRLIETVWSRLITINIIIVSEKLSKVRMCADMYDVS